MPVHADEICVLRVSVQTHRAFTRHAHGTMTQHGGHVALTHAHTPKCRLRIQIYHAPVVVLAFPIILS